MNKKRVLILSYYWPPSGGAGVQRWLKFVKYLPDLGWEPMVYVPENPHYPVLDSSLEKDVSPELEIISYPIWEPYDFYKKFMGFSKGERVQHGFIEENKKSNFKSRMSLWIRSNFFIPDARRFWIKPSVKYLHKYFKDKDKPDLIISTGPPHSMHLIALKLKNKWGTPWIADFRDPWTGIDFYDQLLLTKFADRTHHRQERNVLEQADKVIAVGWHMQKELMTKGAKQVSVITNGYDEEDFKTSQVMDDQKDEEFVLMHLGSINKDRNPDHFWKALSTLCGENPVFASRLKIKLVGTIDYLVEDSIKKYKLDTRLEKVDYIPHAEVSAHLQAASLLLLFLNNTPNVDGILTGKLFEYLASGRRVLCIGSSQGDAAKVIEQCQAGASFGFADEKGMKSFLEREFDHFQKGMEQGVDLAEVKKFSRKQLTEDLDKLMKGLTANKA